MQLMTSEDILKKISHYLLTNNFDEDITQRQARALFTAYCILFDVAVDTYKCDRIMSVLYHENDIEDIDISFEEFEEIMYKDLV